MSRLSVSQQLGRRFIGEEICEDCQDRDHLACQREGGWMHQETFERCGCHLTDHSLDNRA